MVLGIRPKPMNGEDTMQSPDSAQARPNIIYILADDMGYGDVSYLNKDSKIRTEHLDRMASEGMCFTDAHASSAVCTPSRYSIMTGRYCWRSMLKQGVLFGYSKHLIEDGRLTVAQLLKDNGYQTACIGKWHLGLDWVKAGEAVEDVDFTKPIANGPIDFGFDYFYGISASLDMAPYVYIENDRVTALPNRITVDPDAFWREGPTGADFQHIDVLPNVTRKVLDKIDEFSGAPFFIYFPLPAPHTPILPTEGFVGKSRTNRYGDFVLMCDDLVGQVMNKLVERGIDNNTIVIFTSDNGVSPQADLEALAQLGHHSSYVFRGYKADIYEGGHRIPFIVRWPERIAAGSFSKEPICLGDLMATVAELVEVKLPDNAGEDSVSNLPVWLGADHSTPLREATVHHSVNGFFAIRRGQWKLELCPGSGGWSYPRPGEEPADAPPYQLYNLATDICERRNLYAEHPALVEELVGLLGKYVDEGRSTPGAPQPNTGPAYWPQLVWKDTGDEQ